MTIDELVLSFSLDGSGVAEGIRQAREAVDRGLQAMKTVSSMSLDEIKQNLKDFASEFATQFMDVAKNYDVSLKSFAQTALNGIKGMTERAGEAVKGAIGKMKAAVEAARTELSSFAGTFINGFTGALAGAMAIGTTIQNYLSGADALGKMADSLEMNIEDLHAWSEAAARAGGSAQAFQGSVRSLTGQLSRQALTGSSRAGKVLEAAGIATVNDDGSARAALDVMQDLAKTAESMSKEEFMGLGQALGIDTGTIMLLQQGNDALKDAIRFQKELGVYTKQDAEVTAYFNDRIDDAKQAFMALAAVVLRNVVPVFSTMVEAFTGFVVFIRKHETFVKAFFLGIAAVITAAVIPSLYAMAAALLANPITWAVAAVAALALVFEDLVVWAEGGESALADIWAALLGSPEEAMAIWEGIKQALSDVWETVKEYAGIAFDAIKSGVKMAISFVGELIEKIKEFINYVAEIPARIDAAFGGIGKKLSNIGKAIGGIFDALGEDRKVEIAEEIEEEAPGVDKQVIETERVDKLKTVREELRELPKYTGEAETWDDAEIDAPEIDINGPDAPEIEMPEIEAPAFPALSIAAPEIDAPEIDLPEYDTPDIEIPEISMPSLDLPTWAGMTIEAPEVEAPEIEPFDFDAPDLSLPEIDSAAIKQAGVDAFEAVKAGASDLGDAIFSAMDAGGRAVADFASEIALQASETWQGIQTLAEGAKNRVVGVLDDLAGKGAELRDGIIAGASSAADEIAGAADAALDAVDGALATGREAFDALQSLILAGLDAIKSGFAALASYIIDALGGAFSWLGDKFRWAVSAISSLAGAGDTIASAAEAVSGNSYANYNNEQSTEVSIGTVNVQTQATDAEGISRDIGPALRDSAAMGWAAQSNVGVV